MKVRLIILFLMLCVFTDAQELVYSQFSTHNGLPSSNATQVLQDKDGNIWISTVNGVAKFNGRNFERFDINDNLIENQIIGMHLSDSNKVWFIGKSGFLSYYQDGVISSYRYNNQVVKMLSGKESIDQRSVSFNDNSLCFNIEDKGRFSIDSAGNLTTLYSVDNSYSTIDIRSHKNTYYINPIHDTIYLYTDKGLFRYKMPDISNRHHLIVKFTERKVLLANNNILYQISEQGVSDTQFEYPINCINQDVDGGVFISFVSDGFCYFSSDDFSKTPVYHSLKGNTVTSVIRDKFNSIWASTNANGIFFSPSEDFRKISDVEGLYDNYISKLLFANDSLIALTGNYAIAKIKFNKVRNRVFDELKYSAISDILWHKNTLWVAFKDRLSYCKDGELIDFYVQKEGSNSIIKSIAVGYNDDLWVGKSNGFMLIKHKRIIFERSSDGFDKLNVNKIYAEPNGAVWLACRDGLWKYEDNKVLKYHDKDGVISRNIQDIDIDFATGTIWLGIDGVGVVRLNKDAVDIISSKDGLISNSITSIYYNQEALLVGTKNGISKIDNPNCIDDRTIKSLTVQNGLLSNEVNDILTDKRNVFVATNRGLCYFDYDYQNSDKIVPKVNIDNILADGNALKIRDSVRYIDYYTRNVSIKYGAVYFKTQSTLKYRYRLLGLDDKWTYTEAHEANYSSLSFGSYTFQVEASGEGGVWEDNPISVKIKVKAPFWLEWWFVTLLLFVIKSIFVIYRRIKRKRALFQKKIDDEINQYRQVALSRQMNPHFIFNSLNSIQRYILQNDIRQSNRFLTRFSKLIRLILDNSQHTLITLDNEIVTLNLYMELEALRFKERVQFETYVSPDIDTYSVMVPPMLIQPFIENAVWHGIMNKEENGEKGKVSLSFVQENDKIICTVSDNGVGRKKSAELNKEKISTYKSRGTSITQKRVDVINKIYKKNITITYKDPVDSEGNSKGTIVTITFTD